MRRRLTASGLFLAVLALVIAGVVAAGDPATPTPVPPVVIGAFKVLLPEAPTYQGQESALPVPALRSLSPDGYTPHRLGALVRHADGRPVAQLSALPPQTQAVETMLPSASEPKPGELSFVHLATARYTVAGHHVLVTTYRPSPAVAQHVLLLGQTTVSLADGSLAWITRGLDPRYPGGPTSQVVQVRGDLLVTVTSDLPPDQLKSWAGSIVVAH